MANSLGRSPSSGCNGGGRGAARGTDHLDHCSRCLYVVVVRDGGVNHGVRPPAPSLGVDDDDDPAVSGYVVGGMTTLRRCATFNYLF